MLQTLVGWRQNWEGLVSATSVKPAAIMFYLISIVFLLSYLFWLTSVTPWLKELRKPKPKPKPKSKIGNFEKFAFPLIRQVWPSLIAQQLCNVQPMTGPVGGVVFYRPHYGKEVLRTVLDDIVDALIASETDPECIAEEIVKEAFKTCPYSNYYPAAAELEIS